MNISSNTCRDKMLRIGDKASLEFCEGSISDFLGGCLPEGIEVSLSFLFPIVLGGSS